MGNKFKDPVKEIAPHACTICGKVSETPMAVLNHIAEHRVSFSKYSTAELPKKCLSSGVVIKTENRDDYLLKYFSSKTELNKWLRSSDEAEDFVAKLIKRFMKIKKWDICPPSLVFSTLSYLPSIAVFEKIIGKSFGDFCKANDIKLKHKYSNRSAGKIGRQYIIVDTREQKPILFKNHATISKKVDYGDYCLQEFNGVSVERKSLSDFISTISSGYDRFVRELEGAKENGWEIIVAVESTLQTSRVFDRFNKFTKASPEFIFHRARELCRLHSNVQFVFVSGRKEMQRIIPVILSRWEFLKKSDLQYLYEREIL